MKPGRLRHVVGEAIARHRLWEPGHRVGVAVSGGLDSACLLDLLWVTRDWHGGHLEVVTVDHGTRPETSEEAHQVGAFAERLGLPFHLQRAELGPDATEQACRSARYGFFRRLDLDRVALAHHRKDQAETVLLALLRGTGSRGLGAMRPRSGRWVRPLLGIRREALQAWAAHRQLTWNEDPSNKDPAYLRNRIRHEVIPLLEEMRPGAEGALARSARLCALDDALLEALAWREAPPENADLSVRWLREAPEALARRVLRSRLGVGAAQVDALLDLARRGKGELELPGGGKVTVRDSVLIKEPRDTPP